LPPIRAVTVVSPTEHAVALCSLTETLLSGGGACSNPGKSARIVDSEAVGQSWVVSCEPGAATAVAMCTPKH
jgi:hypothetical protein